LQKIIAVKAAYMKRTSRGRIPAHIRDLKIIKVIFQDLNLPRFTGHFKKYTDGYTMKKKGVSDEQAEAAV